MEEQNEDNVFLSILKKILDFFKGNNISPEKENETLAELATKDANSPSGENLTKEDILEICSDIDNTNEAIADWYAKGQPDPSDWGRDKIVDLAKEINPDMTEEEKNQVYKDIDDTLDEAIINESKELANDMAETEINDDELNKAANEED